MQLINGCTETDDERTRKITSLILGLDDSILEVFANLLQIKKIDCNLKCKVAFTMSGEGVDEFIKLLQEVTRVE